MTLVSYFAIATIGLVPADLHFAPARVSNSNAAFVKQISFGTTTENILDINKWTRYQIARKLVTKQWTTLPGENFDTVNQ